MNTTKYKVIFDNYNEKTFEVYGFTEAIIKAMNYAIDKAWSIELKSITDEKGVTIRGINPPNYISKF